MRLRADRAAQDESAGHVGGLGIAAAQVRLAARPAATPQQSPLTGCFQHARHLPGDDLRLVVACRAVGTGNYDVLLLLGGSAVPEDEAEALRQKLEQANPLTEVIHLSGGQPIFDYIMIFE